LSRGGGAARKKETKMQVLTRSIAAAALVVAGHFVVLPAARAQAPSPSPSQAPPTSQSPSADVSDQKLDAAAAALQRVVSLKADFQQRINTAPEADRDKIASEASGALTKAVTDQGLSVEEYSSILTVAQNNADVREKILQRIRSKDDSKGSKQ
jgi:predicted ATPase with chaperone activity